MFAQSPSQIAAPPGFQHPVDIGAAVANFRHPTPAATPHSRGGLHFPLHEET